MLIKFITAVAWIVGVRAVLGIAYFAADSIWMNPHLEEENVKYASLNILIGIPAWAWLVAMYVL